MAGRYQQQVPQNIQRMMEREMKQFRNQLSKSQLKKAADHQHALLYFGVSRKLTFCDNGIYEQPVIDQLR